MHNFTENDKSYAEATKELLRSIIADRDLERLYASVPAIAHLSKADYLPFVDDIKQAFGNTLPYREFNAAIVEERTNATKATIDPNTANKAQYEAYDEGFICYQADRDPQVISNFSAKILEDVSTDDGAECTRSYQIEAILQGRTKTFEVPARDFTRGEWIDEHLGARAWIAAAPLAKTHVVNAIKENSDPQESYNYAHTGWRKIEGKMYYLHAGGGVSQVSQANGSEFSNLTQTKLFSETACDALSQRHIQTMSQVSQVSHVGNTIRVKLHGALENYLVTQETNNAVDAVRASLAVLDITNDEVTVPLLAAVWRAPLGLIDFGVHLSGQTGWGKTELAALAQQHFGSSMTAKKMPGSWSSTENSLEMLLFQSKDAVVVVDDFKPKGSRSDQDRLHAKADGIFRRIGNGAARDRLNKDLAQRVSRIARCMLISTGEDVPRGESLKARAVCVEMRERVTQRGTEQQKRLSSAQKDATSGVYVTAMQGYLEWLSPRIESIQACLHDIVDMESDGVLAQGHARSTTNTANLIVGMRFFLQYACEIGAVTPTDAQAYLKRCTIAFCEVAEEATEVNAHDKASEQWRRLVSSAISAKQAHLLTVDGTNPGAGYGWVRSEREVNGTVECSYRGGGMPIGWVEGDNVYLTPSVAYAVAVEMGNKTGDPIVTTELVLRKFIRQDGLLATTGLSTEKRTTITVRKRIKSEGQKDVFHLKINTLFLYGMGVPEGDSLDSVVSDGPEGAPEVVSGPSQKGDSKGAESGENESNPDSGQKKSCLPADFCSDILGKLPISLQDKEQIQEIDDSVLFLDGDEEDEDILDTLLDD